VEVAGVCLDRLATPSPCRREVPGDGQPDPPSGARHAEEVEYERDAHAPDAFQTFADDEERVTGVRGRVARDRLWADDGPEQVGDRLTRTAGRQEDNRALRVVEPGRVHGERDDREQTGDEAERRPDGHPRRHEVLVRLSKQNVDATSDGTDGRRVVATGRGDESVTRTRAGTPRGPRGREDRRRSSRTLADPAAKRVQQLRPAGVVRHLGPGDARVLHLDVPVVAVGRRVDAQVAAVAALRQLRAVEHGRPAEVEPQQDRLTPAPNLDAHGPAGRDDHRLVHLDRTHRRVQRAEEELEQRRTAELNQRNELVNLTATEQSHALTS